MTAGAEIDGFGPHIERIGPLRFMDRGRAARAVFYGPRAYRRATDGLQPGETIFPVSIVFKNGAYAGGFAVGK